MARMTLLGKRHGDNWWLEFLARHFDATYNSTTNAQNVSLATKLAGEDLTNDVMKVEGQFSYTLKTGDAQVKAGAGLLHTLTFTCNDAAPTAGSIIVYDSLTEANTQIFNHTFTTTPFAPTTVVLDVVFTTGLYIGFTTTADVNVTVSYR